MTRERRMRLHRLVASAVMTATASASTHAQAAGASDGWVYVMRTTIDSGDGRVSSKSMRVQLSGRKMRFEFMPTSATGSPMGGAIVIYGDSSTTTIMPSTHMALIGDPRALGGRALTPTFDMKNVTASEPQDLGVGEPVLGRQTHRYRLTQRGTFVMTLAGHACRRAMNASIETWVASDTAFKSVMDSAARRSAAMLGTDVAALNPTSSHPNGIPLRTVTRTTDTGADGKTITVTSTMEFTEIIRQPIEPAAFDIPDGYQVSDTRAMLAAVPAGTFDSVMAAGAVNAMAKLHCLP
jgi:hypothetical protein